MPSFIESSKTSWSGDSTVEHINSGSLQRIAAAAELMAQNHQNLIKERDNYQRWFRDEQASRQRLERRVSALQGVIKRQKKAKTATVPETQAEILKTETGDAR